MRLPLLLVSFAALLSGCSEGDAVADPAMNAAVRSIEFSTVDADKNSGIDAFRTVTVRDISAWQALWNEHKKNVSPAPALPAVNFSQTMVIGVFLGQRGWGCSDVAIQSVRLVADRKLLVTYREYTPPPGMACTANLTYPSHLVSLNHSNLPVEFAAE